MTATQLDHFGSGSNDIIASSGTNKIVVATGDIGTSMTLDSDIEHLVLEDDTGNDQMTVVLENPTSGSVTVESLSANDVITINAANVVAPNTVHLIAAAGAKFIVTGLAANLDASTVTAGPVGREAGNDAPAVFTGGYGVEITVADQPSAGGDAFSITTGPVNTLITMPATAGYTDGLDTITVNAGLLPDAAILKLDGGANVVVSDVDSAIELLAGGGTLTGTLAVNIVDDGAADAIAVQTGTNDTTINGADEDDVITVDAEAMSDDTSLTLSGAADVAVGNVMADVWSTVTGDLDITLDDDAGSISTTISSTGANNDGVVNTGTFDGNDTVVLTGNDTINVNVTESTNVRLGDEGANLLISGGKTATINANSADDDMVLTLTGAGSAVVTGLVADIDADGGLVDGVAQAALSGTLNVTTNNDAAANTIEIATGTNNTTVAAADGADTVNINAEAMADDTTLTLSGGADVTANNVLANVTNTATGTIQINLDRETLAAGTATTTITSSTAISIDANGTAGEGFGDDDIITVVGAGNFRLTDVMADVTSTVTGDLDITLDDDAGTISTTISSTGANNDGVVNTGTFDGDDTVVLAGTDTINVNVTDSTNVTLGDEGANLLISNGMTATINASAADDDKVLTLTGAGSAVVTGLVADIDADGGLVDGVAQAALSGTLNVTTNNDAAANTIEIATGTNNTTVAAADGADTVNIDAEAMADDTTLTLSGAADVAVSNVMADVTSTVTGDLDITLDDDAGTISTTISSTGANNDGVVNTGTFDGDDTVVLAGTDTINVNVTDSTNVTLGDEGANLLISNGMTATINASAADDDKVLTLTGAGSAVVTGLVADIDADGGLVDGVAQAALSGTLNVTTNNDAAANTIEIATGTNNTTVAAADGADTVNIDAEAMADDTTLTLSGAADVTANNVLANVTNTATGTIQINLDRETLAAGTATTTITSSTAISIDANGTAGEGFADNDTITLAGAGAKTVTDLVGNLTAAGSSGTVDIDTLNNTVDDAISITTGSASMSVTGADVSDTITIDATELSDGNILTLDGAANVDVTNLIGDINAATMTGVLEATIAAAGANASITGGTGNDTVNLSNAGDTLTLTAIETVNGGSGNDTITVTDDALEFIDLIDGTNTLTFEDGNAVDDHTVTGGDGVDTVKAELNANLALTFNNADLSEIETVEITDIGTDNSGTPWIASVTVTGNFDNGQAITFDASSLDAGEVFTFDGRAYNTGGAVSASDAISVIGGAGDDVFYAADLDEERGAMTFDLSSGGTDTIHIRNDDWNGSYTRGDTGNIAFDSGDGSYGLSDGFFVVAGSNGFGVTVTSFASGNGGDVVDITYDVTGAAHPDAATAALLAGTGFDGTSSGQLKVVTLGSTDLSTVASGTVLSINSAVDQTGDGWTVGQIATTLSATGAGTALVGLQDGFYTVAMYSDTSADADAHLFNIIVDGGDSLDFAWTTGNQDHDHIEYIGTLSGIGADTLTADNFI